LQTECKKLAQYQNTHLTQIYDACIRGREFCVLTELHLGSIEDILKCTKTPLPEEKIAVICAEVLKGLEYLHDQNLSHSNLKTSNILLGEPALVKLGDFGMRTLLFDTQLDVTLLAPEFKEEKKFSPKCDIWSLGIAIIEMAEGKVEIVKAIGFSEQSKFSPDCRDFVSQCLTTDPNQRPTINTLLQHPFVQIKQASYLVTLAHLVKQIKEFQSTIFPKPIQSAGRKKGSKKKLRLALKEALKQQQEKLLYHVNQLQEEISQRDKKKKYKPLLASFAEEFTGTLNSSNEEFIRTVMTKV